MHYVDMSVVVAAERGILSDMIRTNIRRYGLYAAARWAKARNIRPEYFIRAMRHKV